MGRLGIRGKRAALTLFLALAASGCGNALAANPAVPKVRQDLTALREAMIKYVVSHGGQRPAQLTDLLTENAKGERFFPGETLPLDPWSEEYVYLPGSDDELYDIVTYGQDGLAGGEAENADLSLQMLREGRI